MDPILQLLLGPGGVTVLTLLIIFGGWKKWWVFGWAYREKEKELAEWKLAAIRGTYVAERVVKIAEKSGNNEPV